MRMGAKQPQSNTPTHSSAIAHPKHPPHSAPNTSGPHIGESTRCFYSPINRAHTSCLGCTYGELVCVCPYLYGECMMHTRANPTYSQYFTSSRAHTRENYYTFRAVVSCERFFAPVAVAFARSSSYTDTPYIQTHSLCVWCSPIYVRPTQTHTHGAALLCSLPLYIHNSFSALRSRAQRSSHHPPPLEHPSTPHIHAMCVRSSTDGEKRGRATHQASISNRYPCEHTYRKL